MTTEFPTVTPDPRPTLVGPPAAGATKAAKPSKRRPDDPEVEGIGPEGTTPPETEEYPRRGQPPSPEMKELRRLEDMTVKEIIEGFGNVGSWKCRITRKEPDTCKDASGKLIPTAGFLTNTNKPFDEEWLQNRYGGGTYELHFKKQGANGGWVYGGQRVVVIAGQPNLAELPGAITVAPATGAAAEAPSLVKDMLAMAQKQVDKADERAAQAERGPSVNDPMIEFLRDQARINAQTIADLQKEIREMATRQPPKPTEDVVKDKWLEKLMDGDSARLQSVRMQYESELRMVKEAAIENEKRLRDAFERDKQDMRLSHEREFALMKSSVDTMIASMKANYETSVQAVKSSFDTQKEIMKADNDRLDRDNGELRVEVKDLRAKKEKTIVEQVKDIQAVKDVMGLEDGESGGVGEKILDALTNPEVIAEAGKLFRGAPAAAPAAPAAPAPEQPARVVRDGQGNRFIVKNGKILPVKPKAGPGSAESGVPFIEPQVVAQVVGYLERACEAGQDPEIVAQSGKSLVPEPVLMAIRDMGGVDVFLSKVAKLPSSSPLCNSQAGRNWVRKVGKALVGE